MLEKQVGPDGFKKVRPCQLSTSLSAPCCGPEAFKPVITKGAGCSPLKQGQNADGIAGQVGDQRQCLEVAFVSEIQRQY
jgi:hypothetical protein